MTTNRSRHLESLSGSPDDPDPSPESLRSLRRAISAASARGATYPWITAVLAGCLAVQTTTSAARNVARDILLGRAPSDEAGGPE